MSEEWDSVTKIGSRTRGSGAGPRETVVRGKAALNAAQRTGGIVATEKKYASANTKAAVEGQHLTKVDRSDDIVKPKTTTVAMGKIIAEKRQELKNQKGETLKQGELATKVNTTQQIIAAWESGKGTPDEQLRGKLERALNVKLAGKNIGEPLRKAKN